jgi:hypothetical protein
LPGARRRGNVCLVTAPLVWLIGPSGVGKSTIGYEMFTQLYRRMVKVAYVDLDQVGLCYPQPANDPNNHRVKAANLGQVWPTYRAAGARCLIVCGGAERAELIPDYLAKVPDTTPTVVRLRASATAIRNRIFLRGVGAGPMIPGNFADVTHDRLERIAAESIAEAAALDRSDPGHLCIDTEQGSVSQLAEQILRACGLSALLERSDNDSPCAPA